MSKQENRTDSKALPVQLGDVTPQNLQQFKLLNVSCLPVRYTDKFYRDLLDNTKPNLIKFAFWQGFAVGAVCCRIEPHEIPGCSKLYIMTLAVLAPYRRRGIARFLLEYVMTQARDDNSVVEVYLHVQISNEDAIAFYLSHGFHQGEMLPDYYKKIDPPHCYVLRKVLDAQN